MYLCTYVRVYIDVPELVHFFQIDLLFDLCSLYTTAQLNHSNERKQTNSQFCLQYNVSLLSCIIVHIYVSDN